MLKPQDIQAILAQHDLYWDERRERMREYRRLYMTQYWEQDGFTLNDGVLRTEVPRAYAVVES